MSIRERCGAERAPPLHQLGASDGERARKTHSHRDSERDGPQAFQVRWADKEKVGLVPNASLRVGSRGKEQEKEDKRSRRLSWRQSKCNRFNLGCNCEGPAKVQD